MFVDFHLLSAIKKSKRLGGILDELRDVQKYNVIIPHLNMTS